MWILCLADDTQEMSSLIFSDKYKEIKMLSAAVEDHALKVNTCQIL